MQRRAAVLQRQPLPETNKESAARVGLRLERCAGSGNAWPGVPVLHWCMQSAVGNSKAVFKLFHLHYITRQHHAHSKNAIAQHCTSARLTLVKHSLALVRTARLHGLEPRDAVLEL
jgi:hypothetical protein